MRVGCTLQDNTENAEILIAETEDSQRNRFLSNDSFLESIPFLKTSRQNLFYLLYFYLCALFILLIGHIEC